MCVSFRKREWFFRREGGRTVRRAPPGKGCNRGAVTGRKAVTKMAGVGLKGAVTRGRSPKADGDTACWRGVVYDPPTPPKKNDLGAVTLIGVG